MNTSPTSTLPVAIVSVVVNPPQRVGVRPTGRTGEVFPSVVGWLVRRQQFGTMTLSMTVRLDTGIELDCEPCWVRPAPNWQAVHPLLGTPA